MAAAPLRLAAQDPAGHQHSKGKHPSGAMLLRAQILLARAHFSSGEIDGAFGQNLRKAIEGYQNSQQLDVTGTLDAPTWAALERDSADVLGDYQLLQADVDGPYAALPASYADKAKLSALGFASALEALGERFHASPALLRRLNPGQRFTKAGEHIVVPQVADIAELAKATRLVIDQSDQTLTVLDAGGAVLAQFPASTGSEHDPLPLGHWKVKTISRNPVFHYNPKLFWDAGANEHAATLPAGPNNPVGVVWIDLSKEHYGIHGTPEPANVGKTQSHGCIRLTNWDATALAHALAAGVDVLMQD